MERESEGETEREREREREREGGGKEREVEREKGERESEGETERERARERVRVGERGERDREKESKFTYTVVLFFLILFSLFVNLFLSETRPSVEATVLPVWKVNGNGETSYPSSKSTFHRWVLAFIYEAQSSKFLII